VDGMKTALPLVPLLVTLNVVSAVAVVGAG
jgi:hypothetical protein